MYFNHSILIRPPLPTTNAFFGTLIVSSPDSSFAFNFSTSTSTGKLKWRRKGPTFRSATISVGFCGSVSGGGIDSPSAPLFPSGISVKFSGFAGAGVSSGTKGRSMFPEMRRLRLEVHSILIAFLSLISATRHRRCIQIRCHGGRGLVG